MIAATYARLLFAGLGLLICATSASAECAWVLWDIDAPVQPNVRPTVYTVDSAHVTKAACEAIAREKAGRPWNRPQDSFVRFLCIPDTVDPRGPKGTK